MTNVSKSPDRMTFQKKGYIKRCEEKGQEPNLDYIKLHERFLDEYDERFDDPERRKNNMEWDLLTTNWILEKVRGSESYAQNLYAAICNNGFIKLDVIPILKNEEWGASWRYAGGIVADMRQEGDYIDWYCSGSGGLNQEYNGEETNEEWQKRTRFVPEGMITDEIRDDLQRLGWAVAPGGDWEKFN
jgi:hypothetical protein